MKTQTSREDTVKTSVSMHKRVSEWSDEMMKVKGFNNFSAYVADLIRRDKAGEFDSKSLAEPTKAKSVKKTAKPKSPRFAEAGE